MNRRSFLRSSAILTAFAPAALRAADSAPAAAAAKPKRALKKAFMNGTLNSATAKTLSVLERFKLVRAAGFAGIEINSAMNHQEVLAAREATGLEIPRVIIATHWSHPIYIRRLRLDHKGLRYQSHLSSYLGPQLNARNFICYVVVAVARGSDDHN